MVRWARALAFVTLSGVGGCYWVSDADLEARLDADGDGVPRPTDCDDSDASVQSESTFFADLDGDGFGDAGSPIQACGLPANASELSTDCDDGEVVTHPGADEICDGADNDCDDAIDEGLSGTWYADADGDGFGDDGNVSTECLQPPDTVASGGDCNDGEPAINPSAAERCDTVDNDCDNLIDDQDPGLDPAQHSWYFDSDGDGYGDPSVLLIRCTQPTGYVPNGLDCADADPDIRPGVLELCNGVDDDCDGTADDEAADAPIWFADLDADGSGDALNPMRACSQPANAVTTVGDCNDGDPAVFPGAQETCNGVDDDCNTLVDGADPNVSGGQPYYRDADGDGFGTPNAFVNGCGAPTGFVADAQDCDDTQNAVNPTATEVCDGIDNDCDGDVDDADPGLDAGSATTFFLDADGDGRGDDLLTVAACVLPPGYAAAGGDCDDADPWSSPGAIEQCDGIDNDCNGTADDAVVFATWYLDGDGDGVGVDASPVVDCLRPAQHVLVAGDCNDANPAVAPGLPEVCGPTDDDCDGLVDDADPDLVGPVWHRDADGDGYGNPGLTTMACTQPAGFVASSGDCSDVDPLRNPAATEVCDGLDNDCDQLVDANDPDLADFPTWWLDRDGDTYGDAAVFVSVCDAPPGYVGAAGDCDDLGPFAASTYPGAEIVAADVQDGFDRDCDGLEECFVDADADGYGGTVGPDDGDGLCNDVGETAFGGDCDDAAPTAHPGALRVVGDGLDNDCMGGEECYVDLDGDLHGSSAIADDDGNGVCTDGDEAVLGDDCNDGNATVWPGAPEQCDNLDNDCNGAVDDGVVDVTWYRDVDGDGFGSATTQVDCVQPAGFVALGGDCDDAVAAVFPGAGLTAADVQDGLDRDCDGFDECFTDGDGDGVGRSQIGDDDGDGNCDDAGESTLGTDCNDADASVSPLATLGPADVDDGLDRDCDGFDECFTDGDGDGFGSAVLTADSGDGVCNDPGESLTQTDCDDADAQSWPNAPITIADVGDGRDRDCDGFEECARDLDGDGVGVSVVVDDDGDGVCDDAGESPITGDCDDTDPGAYPGATPVVADGIDQDCDGREECFVDVDRDGHGSVLTVPDDGNGVCTNAGESLLDDDCDDAAATVYPGAPGGVPEDGVDQDCDGVDECYVDLDLDGFAGSTLGPDDGNGMCVDAGESPTATDCRDVGPGAASVYPGAPVADDDVADGIDQDCDGLEECFVDGDLDGYGSGTVADDGDGVCTSAGEASLGGDCADADPNRSPGEVELCANGIDDDCDGLTDGADTDATDVTWYRDQDDDGWGDPDDSQLACDAPAQHVLLAGDCDDGDDAVNPDATEVCDDGVDNDCDGGPGACLLTGTLPTTQLVVWIGSTLNDETGAALAAGNLAGSPAAELAFGAPGLDGVSVAGPPLMMGGDLATDALATLSGTADDAGAALAVLPDADNDGDDELIVGAPLWRISGPAKGAVIFAEGPVASGSLDSLPRLEGANQSQTGASLAVLGDFYGDGSTVLAVGAPGGVGAVHLIADPLGLTGPIANAADDTIDGTQNQDRAGASVAAIPDTNNDGRPELLVGAPGYGQTGGAFLFRTVPAVATVENAAITFTSGSATSGSFGAYVASAGDVDDDGSPDFAIVDDGVGPGLGTVVLVTDYAGFSVDLDASIHLTGTGPGARVASLGDIDGDGVDDLAVGDPAFTDTVAGRGRVAIFFGPISTGTALGSADLILMGQSNQGAFGASLLVYDLDGDGRQDLVVGAPGEGAAYILPGTLGL
ncbi:MAG: FG-GAP repeat protein [Alphaproteobacteria bacterium]|nr:FG-GAP repeat protein [Alphaproteobacteria bacterium]